jgi:drug/metabolite transporter (DMT)-like permease
MNIGRVRKIRDQINRPYFAFTWILFSVIFQTSAVLFSKKAALAGKGGGLDASIFTTWYLGTLLFLGAQACTWIMALRYFSLSFAFPFTSSVRGFILLGAWLFFHEQIHTHEILGVVMIMVGIILLGRSTAK